MLPGEVSSVRRSVPTEIVGPLERGLAVLRAVSLQAEGRTIATADLVRATGLARSTVDRVLATLSRCGFIRLNGRDTALAPALTALGNAYLSSSGLPDLLAPYADRLAEMFDESVSVAVPDGDGVRFVSQLARRRTMSPVFRVGDLLPAERCAPGALFAAEWDDTEWSAWQRRLAADPGCAGFPVLRRARPPGDPDAVGAIPDASRLRHRAAAVMAGGHAVDDQLVDAGLVAVAMPVRDVVGVLGPAGRTVAALSVVSHTSRHSARTLADHVVGELREAARQAQDAVAADGGHPVRRVDPAGPSAGPVAAAVSAAVSAAKVELGSGYLQSLARGLAVITAFGPSLRRPTLSELAQATGLPRATVRRALITFRQLGYVRADGNRFCLLPRVLELGYAPLTGLSLGTLVEPHLTRLVGQVHESASVSVLSGDDIRYVARVPTVRIMSVAIAVGTRFPAYATAMGRVLLAGLPDADRAAYLQRVRTEPLTRHTVTDVGRLGRALDEAARDGYALVREELEDGLQSIAVPVRDRAGRVVAAANVSTHAARVCAVTAREVLLPALRAVVAAIEADLYAVTAYSPPVLV